MAAALDDLEAELLRDLAALDTAPRPGTATSVYGAGDVPRGPPRSPLSLVADDWLPDAPGGAASGSGDDTWRRFVAAGAIGDTIEPHGSLLDADDATGDAGARSTDAAEAADARPPSPAPAARRTARPSVIAALAPAMRAATLRAVAAQITSAHAPSEALGDERRLEPPPPLRTSPLATTVRPLSPLAVVAAEMHAAPGPADVGRPLLQHSPMGRPTAVRATVERAADVLPLGSGPGRPRSPVAPLASAAPAADVPTTSATAMAMAAAAVDSAPPPLPAPTSSRVGRVAALREAVLSAAALEADAAFAAEQARIAAELDAARAERQRKLEARQAAEVSRKRGRAATRMQALARGFLERRRHRVWDRVAAARQAKAMAAEEAARRAAAIAVAEAARQQREAEAVAAESRRLTAERQAQAARETAAAASAAAAAAEAAVLEQQRLMAEAEAIRRQQMAAEAARVEMLRQRAGEAQERRALSAEDALASAVEQRERRAVAEARTEARRRAEMAVEDALASAARLHEAEERRRAELTAEAERVRALREALDRQQRQRENVAAARIQALWRGVRTRGDPHNPLRVAAAELRQAQALAAAATLIQAAWRGYSVRAAIERAIAASKVVDPDADAMVGVDFDSFMPTFAPATWDAAPDSSARGRRASALRAGAEVGSVRGDDEAMPPAPDMGEPPELSAPPHMRQVVHADVSRATEPPPEAAWSLPPYGGLQPSWPAGMLPGSMPPSGYAAATSAGLAPYGAVPFGATQLGDMSYGAQQYMPMVVMTTVMMPAGPGGMMVPVQMPMTMQVPVAMAMPSGEAPMPGMTAYADAAGRGGAFGAGPPSLAVPPLPAFAPFSGTREVPDLARLKAATALPSIGGSAGGLPPPRPGHSGGSGESVVLPSLGHSGAPSRGSSAAVASAAATPPHHSRAASLSPTPPAGGTRTTITAARQLLRPETGESARWELQSVQSAERGGRSGGGDGSGAFTPLTTSLSSSFSRPTTRGNSAGTAASLPVATARDAAAAGVTGATMSLAGRRPAPPLASPSPAHSGTRRGWAAAAGDGTRPAVPTASTLVAAAAQRLATEPAAFSTLPTSFDGWQVRDPRTVELMLRRKRRMLPPGGSRYGHAIGGAGTGPTAGAMTQRELAARLEVLERLLRPLPRGGGGGGGGAAVAVGAHAPALSVGHALTLPRGGGGGAGAAAGTAGRGAMASTIAADMMALRMRSPLRPTQHTNGSISGGLSGGVSSAAAAAGAQATITKQLQLLREAVRMGVSLSAGPRGLAAPKRHVVSGLSGRWTGAKPGAAPAPVAPPPPAALHAPVPGRTMQQLMELVRATAAGGMAPTAADWRGGVVRG